MDDTLSNVVVSPDYFNDLDSIAHDQSSQNTNVFDDDFKNYQ